MTEIQPADPAVRRWTLVAVVVIAALGIVSYFLMQDWVVKVKAADPEQARESVRRGLLLGGRTVSLLMIGLGIHLWLWGGRIRKADRYPPAGARLARDARVLTGPRARSVATAIQVGAALLCLLTVGLLLAVDRLAGLLEARSAQTGSFSNPSTSAVISRFCSS